VRTAGPAAPSSRGPGRLGAWPWPARRRPPAGAPRTGPPGAGPGSPWGAAGLVGLDAGGTAHTLGGCPRRGRGPAQHDRGAPPRCLRTEARHGERGRVREPWRSRWAAARWPEGGPPGAGLAAAQGRQETARTRHGRYYRPHPACYIGLEMRANVLYFDPVLPDELTRIKVHVRYRRQVLEVEVTQEVLRLRRRSPLRPTLAGRYDAIPHHDDRVSTAA
jgi:hypothetical protein